MLSKFAVKTVFEDRREDCLDKPYLAKEDRLENERKGRACGIGSMYSRV